MADIDGMWIHLRMKWWLPYAMWPIALADMVGVPHRFLCPVLNCVSERGFIYGTVDAAGEFHRVTDG